MDLLAIFDAVRRAYFAMAKLCKTYRNGGMSKDEICHHLTTHFNENYAVLLRASEHSKRFFEAWIDRFNNITCPKNASASDLQVVGEIEFYNLILSDIIKKAWDSIEVQRWLNNNVKEFK